MTFLHNIFVKIGIALTSFAITFTGATTPAPQVPVNATPIATTTSVVVAKPSAEILNSTNKPVTSQTDPNAKTCKGKTYSCSAGQSLYCPAGLLGGEGYCANDAPQSTPAKAVIATTSVITQVASQPTTPHTYIQVMTCGGKYWSVCPAGKIFACPANGNAYCALPLQPQIQSSIPVTPPTTTHVTQPTPASTQTSQPTPDPTKVAELEDLADQLKTLQAQWDSLNEQHKALPCLSFITGDMASKCNSLSIQMTDISNQESTIIREEGILQKHLHCASYRNVPNVRQCAVSLERRWNGLELLVCFS
jgi:hypothetical protein